MKAETTENRGKGRNKMEYKSSKIQKPVKQDRKEKKLK